MKRIVFWLIPLCMSVLVSPSFSALYVDAISLDVGDCFYYDNANSRFVLKTPTGGSEIAVELGDIHVFGGGYDYDFTGTISVTPSNETGSGDLGGRPYATFGTGATMTITLDQIREKATDTLLDFDAGDILLVAEIVALPGADVADNWYLIEAANDPDKFVSVDLAYRMTGGELVDGDVLKMLDFEATWSFPLTIPENSAFDADMRSKDPSLLISAVVPEPATLILLLAGGWFIRKK